MAVAVDMADMLEVGDVDGVLRFLQSTLAGIPYDIDVNLEKHYQSLIYLIFNLLGQDCQAEARTSDGRVDVLVRYGGYVYIFEFKLHGSAEEALAQIEAKEYGMQWRGSGKRVFKVGVEFDFKAHNITRWLVKE
jgi:hypothetical protein